MVKSIVLGSVLLFCVITSGSLAAEYTIGVEDINYLPLYSGEGSAYSGFARELFDLFSKKQGIRFVYKPLPVKRLFKSLLNKSIDFKFPDNPNWQIDMKKGNDVIYSQSVLVTTEGIMVLPENKNKGIEHLKIIGTVMGFTPWEYKRQTDSGQITLQENSSFSGLLKQVISKRIDGAYINRAVAGYHLENELSQPEALVFDDSLPYGENDYFLSTAMHPDIIEAFNRFLMENEPAIHALKVKHGIEKSVRK